MLESMLLTALLLLQATAPNMPPPAMPTLAQPLVRVVGKGSQIYTCAAEGKWTLTAPEATLYLDGKEVGKHGKGPSWTWSDGSGITGKLLGSKPSAQPAKDIPDVTLGVVGTSGPKGFLSAVQHITRTETHGGVAPAEGCDAAHLNEIQHVPYSAVYTFWLQ